MDPLTQQVRRAQRRLNLAQWVGLLTWSLFGWLVVAALAVAAPKVWAMPLDGQLWLFGWLGGAVAAGLLTAGVLLYWRRRGAGEAAMEIDRRCGLRERVASSLLLHPEERETEAGRALWQDATRRVERIDVAEEFRIRPRWTALLPLAPAGIVFLLTMVPNATFESGQEAAATTIAAKEQIKRSADDLRKKIAERKRLAEEQGLTDAGELFKKLQTGLDELAKRENVDRKQALVKLNDLSEQLEKRRQALGDKDDIREKLNQLKNMDQGPADKLVKSLKDGDVEEALKQLNDLKEKLAAGELPEEEQQQLAKQLDQMQQRLQDLADAHQQAKADLQQQVKQLQQAGDLEGAAKAQQQLDKLNAQNEQMQQLQEMGNQLAEAANSLKQGDAKQAADQLEKLAGQMENMQEQLEEMEMLDDAMQQIADAKEAMNCKQCQGQGCEACNGGGQRLAQGNGQGDKPGNGMGEGRGKGDRPEEETDTGGFESRVKGNVGPGKGVLAGEVGGANAKGQVREEIRNNITATKSAPPQPLTGQRLPKDHRDHVKQYLDSLRGED